MWVVHLVVQSEFPLADRSAGTLVDRWVDLTAAESAVSLADSKVLQTVGLMAEYWVGHWVAWKVEMLVEQLGN